MRNTRVRLLEALERLRQGTRRQAVETLAVNGLLGVVGMGAGVVGARLLGPEGKGELATLQVVASVIATVGTLGLFDAIVYHAAREPAEGARDAVAAMVFLLGLGVVSLPIAALLVPWALPESRPGVVWGAQVYLGVFPAFVLLGTVQSLLRARMSLRAWNAVRIVSQTLWLLVLIGAWFLAVHVPEFVAAAYVVCLLALAVAVAVVFRSLWLPAWPPDLRRIPRLVRYGLPAALRVGPRELNLRLDVLVLAAFLSSTDVGLYTAAASWSMMLVPLTQALSAVLFPRLSREKEEHRRRQLEGRALVASSAAVIGGACVIALATPLGFPLLFGERFVEGTPYAVGLLGAGAILALSQILGSLVQSRGRTMPLLWAEVGGLVVTAAGLFILVPLLGVWGAVVVSALSYLVTAGMFFYFLLQAQRMTE